MAIDTSYGPGYSKTTTGNYDVGSPSAGIHGVDLSSIAAAIMAKKNADAAARARQMQFMNQQQMAALAPPQSQPEEHSAGGLDMARQQAELAKLHAISQPPPMRYTYPLGSAGFLTMDTDAMTGAQRQMYLPQNSQQIGGFGPGAASTLPEENGPSFGIVGGEPRQDLEYRGLRQVQEQALAPRPVRSQEGRIPTGGVRG